MSGHFLQPAGVSCLRRLGLFEDLEALRAPAQDTMTVDFGPVVISERPAPTPDGISASYAPRRYLFDPMLANAAVAAGAELREGVSFVEPVTEGQRVAGMRVQTTGGRTETIPARLVIGADGKRSRVARSVGAQPYDTRPTTSCMYYGYWNAFDTATTRLFMRDGLFGVAVPTNDGLTFIGFAWPHAEFARVRRNIGKAFHDAAASLPWIADRFAGAKQVGRFIGTGDLGGFFRTASGPGWALLGDAGYHKDPITAQGMTDALLHAELLAAAVMQGLSAGHSLDAALLEYGCRRDESARPMYALTAELARLAPPSPEMAELVAALQPNAVETRRFLGLMAGTVAVPDFFAPTNLARITGRPLAA
jgi:2-polyprenyl-6-methoxyphenol hydroxylase-like FAD-dependent oxidoreductase